MRNAIADQKGRWVLGPHPEAKSEYRVHTHVDATVARAIAAGAKLTRPVKDQFYGDRSGSLEDPFGHMWHVATHKEDFSKAEMMRRAAEAAKEEGG